MRSRRGTWMLAALVLCAGLPSPGAEQAAGKAIRHAGKPLPVVGVEVYEITPTLAARCAAAGFNVVLLQNLFLDDPAFARRQVDACRNRLLILAGGFNAEYRAAEVSEALKIAAGQPHVIGYSVARFPYVRAKDPEYKSLDLAETAADNYSRKIRTVKGLAGTALVGTYIEVFAGDAPDSWARAADFLLSRYPDKLLDIKDKDGKAQLVAHAAAPTVPVIKMRWGEDRPNLSLHPDYPEIRCLSYALLQRGASGVIYRPPPIADADQLCWEGLEELGKEMSLAVPYFADGQDGPALELAAEKPGLSAANCRARNGKLLAVAVNRNKEALAATLKGLPDGEYAVVRGGGKIEVKGGAANVSLPGNSALALTNDGALASLPTTAQVLRRAKEAEFRRAVREPLARQGARVERALALALAASEKSEPGDKAKAVSRWMAKSAGIPVKDDDADPLDEKGSKEKGAENLKVNSEFNLKIFEQIQVEAKDFRQGLAKAAEKADKLLADPASNLAGESGKYAGLVKALEGEVNARLSVLVSASLCAQTVDLKTGEPAPKSASRILKSGVKAPVGGGEASCWYRISNPTGETVMLRALARFREFPVAVFVSEMYPAEDEAPRMAELFGFREVLLPPGASRAIQVRVSGKDLTAAGRHEVRLEVVPMSHKAETICLDTTVTVAEAGAADAPAEARPDLKKIVRHAPTSGAAKVVAWKRSPWLPLDYRMPARANGEPLSIEREFFRGEKECDAFVLSNGGDAEAVLRVSYGGKVPCELWAFTHAPVADILENLGNSAWMVFGGFGSHLPPKGALTVGPIVRLDSLGETVVPAGESREVFLRFRSEGVAPGEYEDAFVVQQVSPDRREVARVPVRLRVSDVALPERSPFSSFAWDYTGADPVACEALLDTLTTHSLVSVPEFKIKPDGGLDIDFKSLDAAIRAKRGKTIFWFEYSVVSAFHERLVKELARTAPKDIKPDEKKERETRYAMFSADWERLFREYYGATVKHMNSIGLDDDRFIAQVFDEPGQHKGKEDFDVVVRGGRIMKEVAPRVKLSCTVGGGAQELARMAEVLDILVPHLGNGVYYEGTFESGTAWNVPPENYRYLVDLRRQTGKQIWFYICRSNFWDLDPICHYRMHFWKAKKIGLDGAGMFALSYFMGDGTHPYKSFEAWREATEDMAELGLLESEIAKAAERGVAAEKLDSARRLASRSLQDVCDAEWFVMDGARRARLMDAYRKRHIEAIRGLRGGK